MNIFEPCESVLSAPFNPNFLVSFELKIFVLGFCEIICISLREKNLSVRYHLEILKCGVSLEGLFKSEVSLEVCKGYFEPKVQKGGLEP